MNRKISILITGNPGELVTEIHKILQYHDADILYNEICTDGNQLKENPGNYTQDIIIFADTSFYTPIRVLSILTNLPDSNATFILISPIPTAEECIPLFHAGISRIFSEKEIQHLPDYINKTAKHIKENEAAFFKAANFYTEYERLDLALQATEQGVWDMNVLTGSIYLSPKCLELIGYLPEDFDGTSALLSKVIADEDLFYCRTFVNKMMTSGPDYGELEYRIIKKNGEPRWMRSIIRIANRNEDEAPLRVIGVMRDITPQKKQERELTETRTILQSLLNNSPSLIYVLDAEGRFVLINSSLEKIFGKSNEQIRGKLREDVLPSDIARKHRENDLEVLRSKTPYIYEEEGIFIDGKHFYISIKAPLFGEDGETTGICGISIDITKRKELEEELIHTHQRYRQALNRINAVAYVRYFGEEIFNHMGESIENLLGFSRSELTINKMKSITEETILVGDTQELNKADAIDAFYKGTLKQWVADYKLRTKSGNLIWVTDTAVPITNSDNKVIGSLGVLQDITQRKKNELTLEKTLKNAQMLSAFSMRLNNTLELEEIGSIIIETLENLFQWRRGSIWLLNRTTLEMTLIAHSNIGNNEIEFAAEKERVKRIVRSSKDGITGLVAFTGKSINCGHVQPMKHYVNADSSITSELCVPIIAKGISVGCINVESEVPNAFSQEDEVLLTTLSNICASSINNAILYNEQKETLLKLRASEEKYRLLIDNMGDGLVITDLEDRIIFVNKRMPEIYGYAPEEFLGKAAHEILEHPGERSISKDTMSRRLAGEIDGYQIKGLSKNGRELWIHITGAPMYDSEGIITGTIGIIRDISFKKEAEERLHYLSRAIEQNPVSVVITDKNGYIQYVNPKFSELSGFTFEEIIGKKTSLLKSGYHTDEFYKGLWTTLLDKRNFRAEFLNKKKNGDLYWENSIISPLTDENGEIIHFVAVKEDITERKKIFEELIAAKDKALEMSRLKSSFLANMSHELRTPLIGILGYSELLSSYDRDPEVKSMTSIIYKSGRRLLETLNLILDLSRIEADKLNIKKENTNLVPVLYEVAELYSESIISKGLELDLFIPYELVVIDTDINLFRQIVYNLLNNAIKYTQHGSVGITLEVIETPSSPAVRIHFSDTGIGIEPTALEYIWDEFRQVSEGYGRNFEGTGLGLTLTKNFVKKLDGEIIVNSIIGTGSEFIVQFPNVVEAKSL